MRTFRCRLIVEPEHTDGLEAYPRTVCEWIEGVAGPIEELPLDRAVAEVARNVVGERGMGFEWPNPGEQTVRRRKGRLDS